MHTQITILDNQTTETNAPYVIVTQVDNKQESNINVTAYFLTAIDIVNHILLMHALSNTVSINVRTQNAKELLEIFHVYNIV